MTLGLPTTDLCLHASEQKEMLNSAVEAQSSAMDQRVGQGHDVDGHHKGVGAADHGQWRVYRNTQDSSSTYRAFYEQLMKFLLSRNKILLWNFCKKRFSNERLTPVPTDHRNPPVRLTRHLLTHGLSILLRSEETFLLQQYPIPILFL